MGMSHAYSYEMSVLPARCWSRAIRVVGEERTGEGLCDGIAAKPIVGQQLSEYELHTMIDVLVPGKRLENRTPGKPNRQWS